VVAHLFDEHAALDALLPSRALLSELGAAITVLDQLLLDSVEGLFEVAQSA
jgi:hypothetical protein